MPSTCLFLLACISVSIAQLVHYEVTADILAQDFHFVRPSEPTAVIDVRLVLRPSSIEALHSSLLEVSDPGSANYGRFLSKSEVEKLVAPNPGSVSVIQDWLTQHGIEPEMTTPSGDTLRVKVAADHANRWLNASFAQYVHKDTATPMIRTLSYTLPSEIEQHLAFIYPVDQFIPPAHRGVLSHQIINFTATHDFKDWRRSSKSTECLEYNTPDCLQALYGIPTTPTAASGNRISIGGFLDDVATQDDLSQFAQSFRPDIRDPEFELVAVDDGTVQGLGTPEASLDVDYTVGLATNVPVDLLSVGDSTYDGLLDFVNYLLSMDVLPSVITTSYGYDEPLFEQYPELAHTLCNAYAQLGARGTTVLFSSGDGGVAGHKAQNDDQCDSDRPFIPTFPSTCPFVTSVGGTVGSRPEVAAPFSAGGFSNMFARPDYQSNAVEKYLSALGTTNAGRFNASGRAFPDVSTQAVQFVINSAGQFLAVNGTSAASPTFASVVALLNDRRLSAGMPLLGFLNPLLYANASSAFNDIVSGNNTGCGSTGFPALEGWDPVSGLGTPAFNRLSGVATGQQLTKNGASRARPLVMPLALFSLSLVEMTLKPAIAALLL